MDLPMRREKKPYRPPLVRGACANETVQLLCVTKMDVISCNAAAPLCCWDSNLGQCLDDPPGCSPE